MIFIISLDLLIIKMYFSDEFKIFTDGWEWSLENKFLIKQKNSHIDIFSLPGNISEDIVDELNLMNDSDINKNLFYTIPVKSYDNVIKLIVEDSICLIILSNRKHIFVSGIILEFMPPNDDWIIELLFFDDGYYYAKGNKYFYDIQEPGKIVPISVLPYNLTLEEFAKQYYLSLKSIIEYYEDDFETIKIKTEKLLYI